MFSLMRTTCSIPHAVDLPNTYHVLGMRSNNFCILILPPVQICTVFFSCKFCKQPRLVLGVPGLGCTSSTYMFYFLCLVIPPALPAIVSIEKKKKKAYI